MKIILSCGGTGGHIYPALAIADEIREHHPEAQILFIGTHRALENEVIPAHGYDIMNISASGFHRREIWKNVKTLKDTLESAGEFPSVSILTGPEGGFEPFEAELAGIMGLNLCSMGPRIFRCETAPVAALSAVMYATGNM